MVKVLCRKIWLVLVLFKKRQHSSFESLTEATICRYICPGFGEIGFRIYGSFYVMMIKLVLYGWIYFDKSDLWIG